MKRATEQECQRTIVEAAKRGGWLVHAERPAMRQSGKWSTPIQGDAGFPDLVLVHPTRGIVFWELKRKPGKTTDAQDAWLAALQRHVDNAPVSAMVVWVPDEMQAMCEWLVNA